MTRSAQIGLAIFIFGTLVAPMGGIGFALLIGTIAGTITGISLPIIAWRGERYWSKLFGAVLSSIFIGSAVALLNFTAAKLLERHLVSEICDTILIVLYFVFFHITPFIRGLGSIPKNSQVPFKDERD